MKSFSILLATAVLVTTAFAQDTTVKVSYSSSATRLPKVLDALSESGKVKLQAAPALAGEVVLVRVKDVTLQSVMDRIAEVTSGRWEPDGTGFRIVADVAARRQEDQAVQSEYAKSLSKEIFDKAESLRKTPVLTRANIDLYLNPPAKDASTVKTGAANDDTDERDLAAMMGGIAHDPTSRLIIRLAQSVGVNTLANVRAGDRVVFSTNPNGSQLGMGGGGANAVNLFVQEQTVYVEKMGKPNTPPDMVDGLDEKTAAMMEMAKQFMPRNTAGNPIKSPPAKVLLIASRNALMGGLQLSVNVYDAQGNIDFVGSETLGMGGGMFGMAMARVAVATGQGKTTETAKDPGDPTEIKLSENSKKVAALSGVFRDPSGADQKMPDDVKALLLHPEDNDPLSFAPSDALITLAEKRNMPFVACLPDGMISYMDVFSATEKRTLGQFLEQIKSDKSGVVSEKEGFLLFKPGNPTESRSQRVNREALGKLLRAANDNGGLTLEDMAAYAAVNEAPMSTPAAMTSLMMIAPEVVQGGMMGSMDWTTLRFYGQLSPSQRTGMASGNGVPFSSLSPLQQATASRILFGPQHGLKEMTDAKPKDDLMSMFGMGFGGMMGLENGKNYKTEPTEIMPNRLPGSGILILEINKEPMAKLGGTGMLSNYPLGVTELAMFKFFKDEPNMAEMSGSMPSMDNLKVGTRSILNFHFRVARDVEAVHTLQDNLVPKNAPTVAFASLPDDFKKKIEEKMAALKKLPFFDPSIFPGGRQQIPPR